MLQCVHLLEGTCQAKAQDHAVKIMQREQNSVACMMYVYITYRTCAASSAYTTVVQ